MFLDVPFFFYLSGWATNYKKPDLCRTGKGLIRIWGKWVYFISIVAIACALLSAFGRSIQGITDFRDLTNNYMFHVSFSGLPVIAGSIWFMPYYYVVLLVNTAILELVEREPNKSRLQRFYMWFLLLAFVWVSYGNYAFGLDLGYFLFYGFFWMLGYNRFGKTAHLWEMILGIVTCTVGIIIASYLQNIPVYDIQSSKFPPALKYVFVSLISVLFFRYFEGKRKESEFLIHVGRNAIFYFFAQGIGSSFCYYLVEKVKINIWILKWLIIFLANLGMTIILAEIFAKGFLVLCQDFAQIFIKYSYKEK